MRRTFGIIKAFNFFIYGALTVYSTFFALYLQHIGWTALEIGALMAGGPVVSLVANPFWGYLSDRFRNVRLVLIAMITGAMLIMQVVFWTQSDTVIYATMLLFFFFQMPMFSQSNSLILNAIEGTGRRFGEFRLWGSLGWAALAAASGPVIGVIGIQKLWMLYTCMMLLSLSFAFALPKGEAKAGAAAKDRSSFRSVFANRAFLVFLACGLVLSVPNSMNQTFIALYIVQLGGEADIIGWATFLSSIFEIPVFLLLDRYLKRNERTMVLCLVFVGLLCALRWLLMSAAGGAESIIFIQMLHCLTFGGFYYIGTQLTAMLVPAQYRASGQALYALIYGGLSGMAAGFFGGWLFQQHGPQTMYVVGTGMALAGALGFAGLYAALRRSRPAGAGQTHTG